MADIYHQAEVTPIHGHQYTYSELADHAEYAIEHALQALEQVAASSPKLINDDYLNLFMVRINGIKRTVNDRLNSKIAGVWA